MIPDGPFDHYIRTLWSGDAGMRTILYYACLLVRDAQRLDANIRSELSGLVSLENQNFRNAIAGLVASNVMTSTTTCGLTPQAAACINKLIQQDIGQFTHLNGLTIARSNVTEREYLWTDTAIACIRNWFENRVEGLAFEEYPETKSGRILILRASGLPTVIWCFLWKKKRLEEEAEAFPLLVEAGKLEVEARKSETNHSVIRILAAPAYNETIAQSVHAGRLAGLIRLAGPINMAHLDKHFKEFSVYPNEQYRALLTYLDLIQGGPQGIIFAPWVINYIREAVGY